jgi:hypothetical protein
MIREPLPLLRPPVVRGEPIDSRCQDHLKGCRDLDRLYRAGLTMSAGFPGERSCVNERADVLLDEERVPR